MPTSTICFMNLALLQKIKMRYLIVIVVMHLATSGSCQPGFFGSLNRISVTGKFTPVRGRSFLLNEEATESEIRRKNLAPAFSISYSRVVGMRSEVTAGYQFSRLGANSKVLYLNHTVELNPQQVVMVEKQYQVLNNVDVDFHHYNLIYKFYRLGSFAPVGKFIGTGIAFGFTKLKENSLLFAGGRETTPTETNFLRSVYPVAFADTIMCPEITYRYFTLNGTVGRNYPVNRNISFLVSMTFPVLTLQIINGENKGFAHPLDYLADVFQGNNLHGGVSFETMISRSAHKLTRLYFETGFCFHF